jgi:DNA-binding NarL/FixJ family response regulator
VGLVARQVASSLVDTLHQPDSASDDGAHPQNARPCRVLIVEDQQLFADALVSMMGALDMVMLPVASDGRTALQLLRHARPDVVLVDIGLPDMDGISLGKRIIQERPEAKVIALTALVHQVTVAAAAMAGFHGYLTKDLTVPSFVRSIMAILDGEHIFPQEAASSTPTNQNGAGESGQLPDWEAGLARYLTSRELEVLAMLVEGMSGDTIAAQLYVSPHTVRTHIQSILAKLQVHSRLEAVAFAIRNRVLTVGGHPR